MRKEDEQYPETCGTSKAPMYRNSSGVPNIREFLRNFPDKEVNGESVNDIKYDGWPIWWFIKDNFLKNNLLPKLSKQEEIIIAIRDKEELNLLHKLKNDLNRFFIKKALYYNEKSKFWISQFNHKKSPLGNAKDTVMFLAHTNAILFKNSNEDFEVDRIESVIKEVRKDLELQEYISIIEPLSHNAGLKLLKYPDLFYKFINKEIQEKVKESSKILNKKWMNLRDKLEFDSEIETKIFEHCKPAIDFYFSKEVIYVIVLYYETYKEIIREKRIKLLSLYSYNNLIIRCAIAAADRSGIKSLHIHHGHGIPERIIEFPKIFHAMPGEKYKERLLRLGINPKNIFITGPVFMDDILRDRSKEEGPMRTKRILFATQPLIESKLLEKGTYLEHMKKILRDLNKIKDIEVIIKLHPREKHIRSYQSIIDSLGYTNVKIVRGQKKDTLYGLINKSDLVMGFGSTVALEAMVIDKPVINIDLVDWGSANPIMNEMENVVHLKPEDDLSTKIYPILYDEKIREKILRNQQKFVKDYIYMIDGNAGKRVLKIIKKLV